jgi:hypothetical protein
MSAPFIDQHPSAANASTFIPTEPGLQLTQEPTPLQVVCERMDRFKRLEAAFNRVGWGFYPLTAESFLAVHRKWQMSHVCQDFRAAFSLLKRVGGAA